MIQRQTAYNVTKKVQVKICRLYCNLATVLLRLLDEFSSKCVRWERKVLRSITKQRSPSTKTTK